MVQGSTKGLKVTSTNYSLPEYKIYLAAIIDMLTIIVWGLWLQVGIDGN